MSKRVGRKNQNRPAKPASPPKKQRTPLPVIPQARSQNSGGSVKITAVTHQDSILPVPLAFPPPLAQLATDRTTFEYQWQHLTYAFHLPDPSKFPPFTSPLAEDDQRLLKRFVRVCETIAGYGLVSAKGGIKISDDRRPGGVGVQIDVDAPTDEQATAFATRFRQLHQSSSGDPDFSKVADILYKQAKAENDEHSALRRDVLEQWRAARGRLMNRVLPNIVCRMVLAADGLAEDRLSEHEMYGKVKPNDVIHLFNYGELIHFGKRSEDYEELEKDEFDRDMRQLDFILSMLGLVHLYFGYSELIRAAIGLPAAPTHRS